MLGSLIVYLKGMRIIMFQLSGYYYKAPVIVCCFKESSGSTTAVIPDKPAEPGDGLRRATPFAAKDIQASTRNLDCGSRYVKQYFMSY